MGTLRIEWLLISALALSITQLFGCATTATISGDVYYRERIALPPNAEVTVTLEDVSRADTAATIISQQSFTPEGQVPFAFSLNYNPSDIIDRHRYALRAKIHSADNELLWATKDYYGVLTQDTPSDKVSLQVARLDRTRITAPKDSRNHYAYQCDQLLILAIVDVNEAIININGEDLELKASPAASGARYSSQRAQFWNHGDETMIELDGNKFSNCRNAPAQLPWAEAKSRGIDFRAMGNEPGWILELDADLQIEFITDQGKRRIITPVPVPNLDSAQKSSYHAVTEEHDLLLTIETKTCQDSMSGTQFTQSVHILLDGEAYSGCGKTL